MIPKAADLFGSRDRSMMIVVIVVVAVVMDHHDLVMAIPIAVAVVIMMYHRNLVMVPIPIAIPVMVPVADADGYAFLRHHHRPVVRRRGQRGGAQDGKGARYENQLLHMTFLSVARHRSA
jgi:hypothetical protein